MQKFDLLHSISSLQTPLDKNNADPSSERSLDRIKARTDLRVHTVLDKLLVYSNSPSLFLGYVKLKRKFSGNVYTSKPEKEEMLMWNFQSEAVNDGHLDGKKLYDISYVFKGLQESCRKSS